MLEYGRCSVLEELGDSQRHRKFNGRPLNARLFTGLSVEGSGVQLPASLARATQSDTVN